MVNHDHDEDVYVAVRDAFASLTRRLQDFTRRRQDGAKRRAPKSTTDTIAGA